MYFDEMFNDCRVAQKRDANLIRFLLPSMLAFLGAGISAHAADLTCDGVLGNSGEQGASLHRGGMMRTRGLGVAVDKAGFLWNRLGNGVLIRCAAVGRLIGRYRLPEREPSNSDRIAIAG